MRELRRLGYEPEPVLESELRDYMAGETPTGDAVTLEEVLENDYLLVHEVVEVSELKKMGVPVDRETVMRHYPEVYRAHLTALEYELRYALSRGDHDWLRRRLPLVSVEEPYLPRRFSCLKRDLAPLCESVRRRLLELLGKQS